MSEVNAGLRSDVLEMDALLSTGHQAQGQNN
jgi:hypothetical protein